MAGMKTVSSASVKIGEMLNDGLRGNATMIERWGEPIGVFVPIEQFKEMEEALREKQTQTKAPAQRE